MRYPLDRLARPSPRPRRLAAAYFASTLALLGCDGVDTTFVVMATAPEGTGDAMPRDAGVVDDVAIEPVDAAFEGACGRGRPASYAVDRGVMDAGPGVAYDEALGLRALSADLRRSVMDLGARVDSGARYAEQELVAELLAMVEAAGGDRELAFGLSGEPPLEEQRLSDLDQQVSLLEHFAGRHAGRDHRAWAGGEALVAFESLPIGRAQSDGVTPEGLVVRAFEELEVNAINRALGFLRRAPGVDALPAHVTRGGIDLAELLERLIDGAVMFAEATDVLLDDATEGFGLLSSSARPAEQPRSELGRSWDLAFGRFGAARDHDRYTAEEVAGRGGRPDRRYGWHDSDADCAVSLRSEVNLGDAVLAARRDHESAGETELGARTFRAFVAGRRLIAESGDELSAESRAALAGYRDQAVAAWEMALAATAIHHAGLVQEQLDRAVLGLASYDFLEQARSWSVLKGIAISLQYNPRSPMAGEELDALQLLIGDEPALPDTLPAGNADELSAYADDLSGVRDLLQAVYSLPAAAVERW